MSKRTWILGALFVLLAGAAVFVETQMGWGNVIGMLRYDTRREGDLKVGNLAPSVVLHEIESGAATRLFEQPPARPVILVFGSFTWPPFRRSVEQLHELRERFAGQADFISIYIREAHPTDEWQMDSNEKEGVCYKQPATLEERLVIARDFVAREKWQLPLLVDDIDNKVDWLFGGWPERMYVIETDGRIAYKGKTGPFGFHPKEVEAWLEKKFPDVAPLAAK